MPGRTTRTVLITAAAVVLIAGIAAIAFVYSGAYNVAASDPEAGLVRWALHTTQERSIAARGDDVPAAPPVDSAALRHGFEHFNAMCVVCHGAPGVDRGEIGEGLNPRPPDLAEEAAELDERELFWITKNGIRMTGMPAFGDTHSDAQIWAIVAYVETLPETSAEEYRRWVERMQSEASTGNSGADGADGHFHPPGTPAH